MKIKEKAITLKNGQTCILRSAEAKDAAELVDFIKITSGETDFLLRKPEEVKYTVEKELAMIAAMEEAERQTLIVAEVDGEIAGTCSLHEAGKYARLRHRSSIGISLLQKFWGLGIGTAMMQTLLETAAALGFEQMELEVVGDNERAIALYKKLGFAETGRMPDALKRDDGSYCDNVYMMRKL